MAYVYKISNNINNKLYIGLTFSSIQERWKTHLSDRKKDNNKNRPLYRAMNKYGIEHFTIEEIEECDDSIVNEREQYWIQYYQSYSTGYNATLGGEGRIEYNRELIYQLYSEGKTLTDICKILNCDMTVPRRALIAKGINVVQDAQQRTKEQQGKPCRALTKEGIEVKRFASLGDGARFIIDQGISVDTIGGIAIHIGHVCNGKRKTAYGYKWEFICPAIMEKIDE